MIAHQKQPYLADCVFDSDDWYPMWDRNAMNQLLYLKWKFPRFKATLFVVPKHVDYPLTPEIMGYMKNHFRGWLEFAVHGLAHPTPTEAQDWNEHQANYALDLCESYDFFVQGFKAPGWQISDATYQVLFERGYWVADQDYNNHRRPKELPCYLTSHPWMLHTHTWNINEGHPVGHESRNGIGQLLTEHTLPFDNKTKFHFVSEVVKPSL